MSNRGALRSALTDFVKRKAGGMNALVCKVKEVDSTKNTCYCVPVNGKAVIPNARLIAVPDKKGLYILPKKDSLVVVEFFEGGSAYVSMFSEIDDIKLDVEKTIAVTAKEAVTLATDKTIGVTAKENITVSSDKIMALNGDTEVKLNGSNFFGLVKVAELTTKLNNLENLVNDLISKYNTHKHSIPVLTTACGAGAGTTATSITGSTATSEPTTLTPTLRGDIENTKVTHGGGS